MVDRRFFSLNSNMFDSSRRVSQVPFLRAKAYLSTPENINALVGQYQKSVCGGPPVLRDLVRSEFLKRYRKVILDSQRSVTRGLGMRASKGVLRMAGLWDREKFYLSLPGELTLPNPPGFAQYPLPGWSLEEFRGTRGAYRRALKEAEVHSRLLAEWSQWAPVRVRTVADYRAKLREGTFRWRKWVPAPFVKRFGDLYKSLHQKEPWKLASPRPRRLWRFESSASKGVCFYRSMDPA